MRRRHHALPDDWKDQADAAVKACGEPDDPDWAENILDIPIGTPGAPNGHWRLVIRALEALDNRIQDLEQNK